MVPQGTLRAMQGTARLPQGTLRGPRGTLRYSGGQAGGAAPFYRTLDGVAPVAGWNFKTGESTGLLATDAFTGLNITAAGLTINTSTNVDATAALRTLMAANYTWVFVLAGRAGLANAGVLAYSATEAPVFIVAGGQVRAYKSPVTGLDNTNRFTKGGKRIIAMSRSGTARQITQNGMPVVTDSTVQTAAPSAVQIGRFNGGSYLNDDIEEAYLFDFAGTSAGLKLVSKDAYSSPLSPVPYFRGSDNQYIDYGASVLKREADLPWSLIAVAKPTAAPDASGTWLGDMLFTTVAATSIFPGYEVWFSSSDGVNVRMHIRIISAILTPAYIGAYVSTTVLTDPWSWLTLGFRYDGSRTAAGCDFWLNGVKQTRTVESDTLGANSILGDPQRFVIGNQTNRLGYYLKGNMAFFHFRGDAPNDAFFSSHGDPSSLPAADANTLLQPDFANVSGTSVPDLSPSGLTGTLSTTELMIAP